MLSLHLSLQYQSFFRYLCGQSSALGVCTLLSPPFLTLAAAETHVLAGSDFASWADPNRVIKRSARYMTAGRKVLQPNQNPHPNVAKTATLRVGQPRSASPRRLARDENR